MTNGEKIIETFPDEDGVIVQGVTCVYYGTMRFDTTWWNQEYREPREGRKNEMDKEK